MIVMSWNINTFYIIINNHFTLTIKRVGEQRAKLWLHSKQIRVSLHNNKNRQ